jgi:glycosyltransferase 2 family protein
MTIKQLIKPIISICMLALVLSLVDLSSLVSTMLSVPAFVVVTVVVGYTVGQIISAYKWWLIATAGSIETSYPNALKSYFIGMFANCFGLGTLGGDLTRAVLLANGKSVKAAALASVVADRAHGLAVLALLGTIATACLGTQSLNSVLNPGWVYLLVIIGTTIVVGWLYGPRILLRIVREENPLRKKAEQISEVFPKKTSVVLYITLISAAFHLLQISLHWIMGYGFGLSISWPFLLVTIPFINILSSLPISWNGLGVREASYIFFFASANILSQEQAITFGAIWLLAVTISSSIGGVISFLTRDFRFIAAKAQG